MDPGSASGVTSALRVFSSCLPGPSNVIPGLTRDPCLHLRFASAKAWTPDLRPG
jgi:hypothetical protein